MPAVPNEALHAGLPRGDRHPGIPGEGRRGRLRGRPRDHQEDIPPACGVRTRLPAGEAVPEVLHDGQAAEGRRQGSRDRARREVRRGPGEGERGEGRRQGRRNGCAAPRPHRQARGRHRLRPGVHHVRGGLRKGRARRDRLRGLPQGGRSAGLRHSGVPPPQGDRARGDPGARAPRREVRDELRRRAHEAP